MKRTVSLFFISLFTANTFVFSESNDVGKIVRALRNSITSFTNTFTEKEDDESSLTKEESSKIDTITTVISSSTPGKSDTKKINLSTGTGNSSVSFVESGETQLRITANVFGAAVYVDGSYKGTTPLTIKKISPGSYKIRVESRGYETYETVRNVQKGKTTNCSVSLTRQKGVLVINTNQSNVKYYCDGVELYSNINRIPEGSHIIKVRKFGYKDFESSVYIAAYRVKRIYVTLVEAPFEITQLTASSDSFNPNYSDRHGRCSIVGYVTNKGSGTIEIFNSAGQSVSRKDFSQFTTWEQYYTWDGKDSYGKNLPEGAYTVKFTAENQSLSLQTRIDYSIKYFLYDFAFGGLGIGTVPVALPEKQNSLYAGISIKPAYDSSKNVVDVPVGLLFSYTLIEGLSLAFDVTGYFTRDWQIDLNSEGLQPKIPSRIAGSLKYSTSVAEIGSSKLNIGFSGGYGYSEVHTFAPYGVADGKGLNFSAMLGLDFSKLFLGFTSQIFLGSQTCKANSGDNTIKNALTLSFMPNLYFAINGWAAIHSVTGVYHAAGSDFSEGVTIKSDFTRAIELGFDLSLMLPFSSVYFTAGSFVYYYPLKKVYYNGFFGVKFIM